MKKAIIATLAILLVLSLSACKNPNTSEVTDKDTADTVLSEADGTDTVVNNESDGTSVIQNEDVQADDAPADVTSEPDGQDDGLCGYPVADKWGVYLTAKDVTPEGLTLVCTQNGGNAEGELQTGSYYRIERYESKCDEWTEADCYAEVSWTMEAWMIPSGQSMEWKVDWGFLYGKLEPGYYRIVKEIMDFTGTGNFEKSEYYATFEIVKSDITTRCALDLK